MFIFKRLFNSDFYFKIIEYSQFLGWQDTANYIQIVLNVLDKDTNISFVD